MLIEYISAVTSTAFRRAPLLFFFLLLFMGQVIAQATGSGPTGSFTEAALDDSLIRNAVGNLFQLIEGAFGALIMVVAGILAIIAAAMGGYRAALGMLIVALGAFILRALVSLFFGADFDAYQG
jgi:hypothetical protein